MTAVANSLRMTAEAEQFGTATPLPPNWVTPVVVTAAPTPKNQATAQAWFTAVVSGEARWNARIGEGVSIRPYPPGTDLEGSNWVVQDGIVVIPKDALIHPGTYIGPD